MGRLLGENPVIGIRPVIDAREGMLNVRGFSGRADHGDGTGGSKAD